MIYNIPGLNGDDEKKGLCWSGHVSFSVFVLCFYLPFGFFFFFFSFGALLLKVSPLFVCVLAQATSDESSAAPRAKKVRRKARRQVESHDQIEEVSFVFYSNNLSTHISRKKITIVAAE